MMIRVTVWARATRLVCSRIVKRAAFLRSNHASALTFRGAFHFRTRQSSQALTYACSLAELHSAWHLSRWIALQRDRVEAHSAHGLGCGFARYLLEASNNLITVGGIAPDPQQAGQAEGFEN